MSRHKKKQAAKGSQRKQAEIEARMKKAEENKAKREAAAKPAAKQAPKPLPEKSTAPAVPKEAAAKGHGAPRDRKHAAARHAQPAQKPVSIHMTDAGDAGMDCRRYDCCIPERSTLESVMKAIRNDRPRGESGTLYISVDVMPAHAGHAALSYELKDGVFTRREKLSQNKKHTAPLLSDILDRRVAAVRASGGWGRMDWFVDLVPDLSDKEPEPYDQDSALEALA